MPNNFARSGRESDLVTGPSAVRTCIVQQFIGHRQLAEPDDLLCGLPPQIESVPTQKDRPGHLNHLPSM